MQMLRVSLIGFFLFGAAPLVVACGSDVNNGGQGGSAGSGGQGGQGGGSTGEGKLACMDFCHAIEVNNCPTMFGDCTVFCDGAFAEVPPACDDEFGAVYSCYLPTAATCPMEPPQACNDKVDAAQSCQAENGCVGGECFGGGGPNGEMGCGCSSTCKGTPYATNCTTPADGSPTTCTCSTGDTVLGTCMNPDANACGVETSCCAQYFNL